MEETMREKEEGEEKWRSNEGNEATVIMTVRKIKKSE